MGGGERTKDQIGKGVGEFSNEPGDGIVGFTVVGKQRDIV